MATDNFESIIRNKTWQELSASERDSIKEIAPDEAAFHTAKQILLLAAEGWNEVPQLERQMRYMPPAQPPRKKTTMAWYGAAALFLALATAAWWYSQQSQTTEPATVVVKQLPKTPAKPLPDTTSAPQHTAAETQSLAVKHTAKPVTPKKETTQPGVPAVHLPQGDASVFLAANEPALVDLVVEMY